MPCFNDAILHGSHISIGCIDTISWTPQQAVLQTSIGLQCHSISLIFSSLQNVVGSEYCHQNPDQTNRSASDRDPARIPSWPTLLCISGPYAHFSPARVGPFFPDPSTHTIHITTNLLAALLQLSPPAENQLGRSWSWEPTTRQT